MSKTETENKPSENIEDPQFKVSIWFEARTSPDRACKLEMLGFDIAAHSPDYISLNPIGFNKFPEGAWITGDDLQQFIDGLIKILEKADELPSLQSYGVNILWKEKEAEAK